MRLLRLNLPSNAILLLGGDLLVAAAIDCGLLRALLLAFTQITVPRHVQWHVTGSLQIAVGAGSDSRVAQPWQHGLPLGAG